MTPVDAGRPPDTALGVADDPDGPLLDEPALLPILSRDPESLPVLEVSRRPPEWVMRIAVLLLGCGLFLPNLGSFGLWDPWETHYGEVTRYMIERGDWVHPRWGYNGKRIAGEKGPGEEFYSKPILLFWMEAATIKAIGLSELAIRLPVAFIAILTMFSVYFCFSKLWGRWGGLRAAIVLGTCPQFFFLARQSQTDMPFVGTLTIAISFFCLALFGKREKTSDRRMWAILIATLGGILLVVLPQLGIIASDVPLLKPDGSVFRPLPENAGAFAVWKQYGWMQAVTYAGVLGLLMLTILAPVLRAYKTGNGSFPVAFKDQLRRKCYLWIFYVFCGLSLMAKGLLGFMLPGAIIFVYLVLTNEWTTLLQPWWTRTQRFLRGRVELMRGITIFLCVGLPWYVGLLAGPKGKAFWTRFFIHDHFNRLGSGVHSIDDGTFEHFIKWLGYGMWPWIALVPLAIMLATRIRLGDRTPESRLRLFVALWFVVPYALFSMSSTKFHHYIFPALPPMALMVSWSIGRLLRDRSMMGRAAVALGIGLFGVLAWDLHENPQHFRNLFTYKYDREWPKDHQRPIEREGRVLFEAKFANKWEPPINWGQSDYYRHTPQAIHGVLNNATFRYENWIPICAGIGCLALVGLMFFRTRLVGTALLAMMAGAMAIWSLNYYMPMLGPHWSQKYLFDKYYEQCHAANNPPEIDEGFTPLIAGSDSLMSFFEPRGKRVCKEEVISWLLTWRGETFYANNTIRPIQKEKKQMQPWLKEFNGGARFFVHIERTRADRFEGIANKHLKKLAKHRDFKGIEKFVVTLEHNENYWFVLLKAEPKCKKGYTKDLVGRCRSPKKKAAAR